jgi:hypothetical protein
MSPTRKPRPPDKGAPPEHKPSRKVALEEVMRSLQDLVSNELADEPAKRTGEPAAAEPAQASDTGNLSTGFTAAPQTNEAASAETAPDTEFITLESLPELPAALPSAPEPEPQATPSPTVPAGGLQQELPYLDAQPPEPETGPPEAAAESRMDVLAAVSSTVESDPGNLSLDDPSVAITGNRVPLDVDPLSEAATVPAPVEEINWDDIPVLEEAVDMPDETMIHETGHAMDRPAAAYLPPADAARRLAIQVAARLNVELRKSGQEGLNSDIITRLARLLQEALAKGASNMENTPPDKH